ncbi:MAG: repressor LexA [Elusimicrobia bacterium]|nr:repressor LexA [Elusimicrobiota bacterium]
MNGTPLTHKQEAILRFIESFAQENHVPPTLRDIGRHFDVSVGTAQDQVEALRRKGYLDREPSRARGLRLPAAAHTVPIVGRVFAGTMHAALEDVEGHLPVDHRVKAAEHFALRVRGDSMTGAGINDGDLVIVRRQPEAREGEIVVARADDDATVKRLGFRHGVPILFPENPKYSPIEGPFEILGVVTELRRHFK